KRFPSRVSKRSPRSKRTAPPCALAPSPRTRWTRSKDCFRRWQSFGPKALEGVGYAVRSPCVEPRRNLPGAEGSTQSPLDLDNSTWTSKSMPRSRCPHYGPAALASSWLASCCTRKRNSLTEYSRAAAPGYQRFHAWSKAAASYRSLTFRPHLTKTTAPRVANHTQRNRRGGSPACWYAVIQGSQPSMKKSRWKKLSPIDFICGKLLQYVVKGRRKPCLPRRPFPIHSKDLHACSKGPTTQRGKSQPSSWKT